MMNKKDVHIVIMAGGIGSRLWPLSTPEFPKQFADILGVGKSLIQLTVERFSGLASPDHFWVVTSERYVGLVREQLPQIPVDQILAEPQPRNTAPCIAYACRKIAAKYPEANLVVTPSDALVLNTARFTEMISSAIEATATSERIVTIGIAPTRPETGYGYICAETGAASALDDEVSKARATAGQDAEPCGRHCPKKIVKVSAFKEKPTLEVAKQYLASGNYFWNAGIFVWSVKTAEAALRTFAPQISGIMDQLQEALYTPDEQEILGRLFPLCDKISIDYAVMEKSPNIYVIAGDVGWSDLGTWGSVKGHIVPDENGNSCVGEDVRLFNTKDCVVRQSGGGTLIVSGLSGYIVASGHGNVLVCPLRDEQHIKEYSASPRHDLRETKNL